MPPKTTPAGSSCWTRSAPWHCRVRPCRRPWPGAGDSCWPACALRWAEAPASPRSSGAWSPHRRRRYSAFSHKRHSTTEASLTARATTSPPSSALRGSKCRPVTSPALARFCPASWYVRERALGYVRERAFCYLCWPASLWQRAARMCVRRAPLTPHACVGAGDGRLGPSKTKPNCVPVSASARS